LGEGLILTKENIIMRIASQNCLNCGSKDITADYLNCDEVSAWRTIECNECGFQWNEVYTFSHNEDIVTCAKLEERDK
jgi:predicted RNA-binding Zn-ribbon protein involved in translation (DUF1610 family)